MSKDFQVGQTYKTGSGSDGGYKVTIVGKDERGNMVGEARLSSNEIHFLFAYNSKGEYKGFFNATEGKLDGGEVGAYNLVSPQPPVMIRRFKLVGGTFEPRSYEAINLTTFQKFHFSDDTGNKADVIVVTDGDNEFVYSNAEFRTTDYYKGLK